MKQFITFLIENMKSDNTLIDIDNCEGTIKKGFILFNHFKDILKIYNKKYNITQFNKKYYRHLINVHNTG